MTQLCALLNRLGDVPPHRLYINARDTCHNAYGEQRSRRDRIARHLGRVMEDPLFERFE